MVRLYKSCMIFHKESEKLGLHFSEFSSIFYAFYNGVSMIPLKSA
jgi:hypothetical protein